MLLEKLALRGINKFLIINRFWHSAFRRRLEDTMPMLPSRHGALQASVLASEQERPEVAASRKAWRAALLDFVDETGCVTNMARRRGGTPRASVCGDASLMVIGK
jgi:hypothetical protein